nr:hypothetical protein [Streptomyces geranii]
MPRWTVSRSGTSLRGRIGLLCLFLLVVGSPWGQRQVGDYYVDHYDDEVTRWFVEGAFVPRWDFSADEYIDYLGSSMVVVQNISVVLLLLGLALAMKRLRARGTAGWGRCLLVVVLVSEAVALVRWWMLETFVDGLELPDGWLRTELLHAPLAFGLVVGVLVALLTVGLSGLHTPFRALSRPTPRRRKGAATMTTTPQTYMPVGSAPGDVTRYLCAAAYVDEGFAGRVVEDVLSDEAGAVAPSPGVDLVAVAHHCLAAQEIRRERDLRLAGAFGVVAVFAPLWLVFSGVFLWLAALAGRARPGLASRGRQQTGSGSLVRAGIAAAVLTVYAFYLASSLAAQDLPGFAAWLLGAYLAGIPAVFASVGAVLFAYATVVRHDLGTDRLLRSSMTREKFGRGPLPPVPSKSWIAKRLAVVRAAQNGNVTVYSGFAPFIGYAGAASDWPLAVPLLPAEDPVGAGPRVASRPGGPEAFTAVQLVDHVREQLREVAARAGTESGANGNGNGNGGGVADAVPETLRSLTVEDRVFVNGATIGDDGRFIAPAELTPTVRLSAEAVEEIVLRPTGTVRHHLAVHVPLWGGDVVPSVFLHFSVEGRTLHVHCSNHVLGPVAAAYHAVDRLRDPLTPERERGLVAEAVGRTATAFLGAPSRAMDQALFESRRGRRLVDELTAMEQDPAFDYGARLSVREMALSPTYHNYFQVVDAERITSAVQRHTLVAIREFLDARGYDTTDFRAQQQTILNQGVIQQGGTSIVGNQAIGAGAKATQNLPQQPGPAAASTTAQK